ncbi:MAG: oligosaccharide flippase family protein [Chitinophagaceae bacterium]
MSDNEQHSKRIAKNTLFLYFRMILTMGVQLFTVREVLNVLGVTDYGLYNVVGGVVTMFSFLSGTMATASQRFFAFELGQKNYEQLKNIFSLTLLIYCFIAVIILILAETLGLWFLNHRMTIPENRLTAANWVYQFSILSFMLTMFQIPYDALVIARERMNIFAYLSILEVVLKLIIVYLLIISPIDKLISYAILICIVTFVITTLYKVYCLKNFKESHFKYYWDKNKFKEILSYSGWNLFGTLSSLFNNQGVNILLNIFFGPVVNTARSIAFQISTALNGFVQNFMTATRPQITKYYAQGDKKNMINLVFQSSKYAFFLLYIITLPVIFKLPFILKIWLTKVPANTVTFTRIIIMTLWVDVLSYPLMASFQATGHIKVYQITVGVLTMLNIPISYVFLKLGYPVYTPFTIIGITVCICLILRLFLLKRIIHEVSIVAFLRKVIVPILLVGVTSILLIYFISNKFYDNLIYFFLFTLLSIVLTSFVIYFLGTSHEERFLFKAFIKKKLVQKKPS